jgi:DNA-binding MarR family transcriptional regulator
MDPVDENARDLGLLMAVGFNAYVDALHGRLVGQGHDVRSPYDGYLFRVLHDEGRATVSELGQILGVTKQAASQAVQSLQRRGLVVVEADGADARRRLVRLSPEGEQVRRSAIAYADATEAALVERLGPRKVGALREALETLIELTDDEASPLVQRLATIGR